MLTTTSRQGHKPPTYRRHATGKAFVQHQGKRYYLGTYGTEKSRERYQRFLAEVWTKPKPVAPPDQTGRRDHHHRIGGIILDVGQQLLREEWRPDGSHPPD